jgi:hypothetical protein
MTGQVTSDQATSFCGPALPAGIAGPTFFVFGVAVSVEGQGEVSAFDDGSCGPLGEVGEGAVLDLAFVAKGFPEEDSGGGVAVGDGSDIHDFYVQLINSYMKENIAVT